MDVRELKVSELNPPLKSVLVSDVNGLNEVEDFFSRSKVFGLDVETNIVNSFVDRKLRTIQVGDRNEQYVIDLLAFAGSTEALVRGQGSCSPAEWAKPVVQSLQFILLSGDWQKVGTNIQFDYEALKWCLGLRTANMYDCLLAEKCIYSGKVNFFTKDFWALDDMLLRYTGLKIDKSLQTSFDLESPLTPEQIEYAALDVRTPLAIQAGQRKILKARGLETVVDEVENPAIGFFGDMHVNGILLDKSRWFALVDSYREKHKENVKTLDTFFLPVVGDKRKPDIDVDVLEKDWRDEKDRVIRAMKRAAYMAGRKAIKEWKDAIETYEGEAAINYGSNPQLLAALRQMGFGVKALPDTNDRTLGKLAAKNPVIKALQDYRETAKILSTYGEEFYNKNCNAVTGRVHSRINQIGAETGRTSSTAPNIQNIPKRPEWRACFVPRPGYKMITIDMSGAELRILAESSLEQSWIDAFAKGWDVHSVGAEILFGDKWKAGTEPTCAYYYTGDHAKCKCKAHKELRDHVKAINFGIAYGMEAQKLADTLGITKAEAQELLDRYRATFLGVMKYLSKSGQDAKMDLKCRTLSGRIRYFNKPDWNKAREKALEEGIAPELLTKVTSRLYHAQYGSIEREGKNTPIQGTNADIAKRAGALMWHRLEPEFGAYFVNFVHDEFVAEVPEENSQACFDFMGECIRVAGARFMKHVVMEYEGKISDCWVK